MSVNLILSPHFPRELLPYDNSFACFTSSSKRKQNYDFSFKPPQFHIDFPFLLTSTAPLPVQLKKLEITVIFSFQVVQTTRLVPAPTRRCRAAYRSTMPGTRRSPGCWSQRQNSYQVHTVGAAFFLSAITGFCGRGEQVQSFLCVGYNNICKLFFRPKKTFFLLITSFFVIISTVSYKLIGGLFLFVLSYSYFIIDISMDPKHQ